MLSFHNFRSQLLKIRNPQGIYTIEGITLDFDEAPKQKGRNPDSEPIEAKKNRYEKKYKGIAEQGGRGSTTGKGSVCALQSCLRGGRRGLSSRRERGERRNTCRLDSDPTGGGGADLDLVLIKMILTGNGRVVFLCFSC